MRGFANYTSPQLGGFFSYAPVPISSPENVELFQFRGIGFGIGGTDRLAAPNFSTFSYSLNFWSSQAAVLADPVHGDLYSIPLVSTDSQYPVFVAYGIGPDIGFGGHHETFEMTVSHLDVLHIGLTANQTYFLGFGIDIPGTSQGDWRWVESTQNLPSDTVISTAFGSPWGPKLASTFTDATTGRLAQQVIAQTVPEPGTVVTLLLGASALCALRRPRASRTR